MLFDIFYHLIKCHHVMTQFFWEDVMSDVRCEMNGEEAYWGCVDSRLKVGCWANRKLAGVTSLPAHLWTSTEIFCHLVMQWSVLQVMADYCKFCNLKGKHVDFKIDSIRCDQFAFGSFPRVVDCQEHHPLGDVGFHLHWLAFWFPALPWSHSRWQLRPVVKASMPHSVTALNSTALHRSWVGFLCLGQWLLSLDDQMASCQSRGRVFQSHWKRLKGKGYIEGCYDKAHGVFSRPWSWNLFLLTGLGNLGTTWKLIFQRQGHENLQRIKETLAAGDNVVLMANHQTEADPQVGKE